MILFVRLIYWIVVVLFKYVTYLKSKESKRTRKEKKDIKQFSSLSFTRRLISTLYSKIVKSYSMKSIE